MLYKYSALLKLVHQVAESPKRVNCIGEIGCRQKTNARHLNLEQLRGDHSEQKLDQLDALKL